ncbi:SDR family NAD(P)-dependent oxidoreductase [Streptomyces phaeochromogenes]|uniref:SDR family NAD(P)-dependent oxidoreductase n=1 Tax=Streptomyces phaeochromogenes TaxID=1923 RepID=UPI002E2E5802|nr:SDR family NAD(P)-dependent oxidoreductase [Streptomyces phaeochromogenes]
MADQLDGTVAMVTGASSGIGRASARQLAARGAAVALVARRKNRLTELADEISAAGGTVTVVDADITDRKQASTAVERTMTELGRLDTVVNCAGVMLTGPADEAPVEEWERMVSLNLMGLLYVSHAALPHLISSAENSSRRVADLVNVSSGAARTARGGAAVYAATKMSVNTFSEALRQEAAPHNVRVSIVEPGAVDTELFEHQRPVVREHFEQWLADVEKLWPEDIADAIEYIVTRPRRVTVNDIMVRPTDMH